MIDLKNGDLIYDKYIKCVDNVLNDNELFKTFKSNNDYRFVLEHVSYDLGLEYLKDIELSEELWGKVLSNDSIGNPYKYEYDLSIGKRQISPTTLRYIKYAMTILSLNKKKELNIVEIGGGYGGLCKIILDLSEMYEVNVLSYSIYDLEGPSKLAKIYLDNFYKEDKIKTGTVLSLDFPDKVDLLIGLYSYSEISKEFRELYEDLILKSVNGYLCWNSNMSYDDIKNELNKEIKIEEEKPLTGIFNRIILW